MILTTGYESMARSAWRIDPRFFADKGQHAALRVHNGPWPKERLANLVGAGNVWMPGRSARVYATDPQYGKPFLVPYDTHRYFPSSDVYLSRSQMFDYQTFEVQHGWLLITRSGRNLGPIVYVDRFIEQFAISDDMVRISGGSDENRLYIMAFLHTPTGQHLIRRDKNGSVIDHIGPKQVQELVIPIVGDNLRTYCIQLFERARDMREQARLTLQWAGREFLRLTGLERTLLANPPTAERRFTATVSSLGWRVDAEPHAPHYADLRKAVDATGNSHQIRDLADIFRPPGRYRTYYVEQEQYGRKLLSGRQLAQYRPIALKIISPLSFKDPDQYVLGHSWVLMTADGRAQEHLADCALVTSERVGWAASGHVLRLSAVEGVHPGLLYLACTADPVQAQLKALATGSVVDALSGEDVGHVLAPLPTGSEGRSLGEAVMEAWRQFGEATATEDSAISALETELSS